MNKLLKSSVMLTLSLFTIAGCSNSSIPTSTSTASNVSGYSLAADTTVTSNASPQPNGNQGKGFRGGKGGQKGGFGMGFGSDLNLTADQKTQLKAIMESNKPQQSQPDTTKMDVVKTAFSDAFLADTFDAAALKTKLESLKPAQTDDGFTQVATVLVQSYNILTVEQKATLEAKQAEMAAKTPTVRPTPSEDDIAKMTSDRVSKLATDLSLDETQKASISALMQPPVKVDDTAEQAKRKASHDAINAALKSGANIESVAAILKANIPTDMASRQSDEIDRLAKIHDILNADQRKIFIDNNKGFGFGHGGRGGHGRPVVGEPQDGYGGNLPNGGTMPSLPTTN